MDLKLSPVDSKHSNLAAALCALVLALSACDSSSKDGAADASDEAKEPNTADEDAAPVEDDADIADADADGSSHAPLDMDAGPDAAMVSDAMPPGDAAQDAKIPDASVLDAAKSDAGTPDAQVSRSTCIDKASQVLGIGDSFMLNVMSELAKLAHTDGALASGAYPSSAATGASMGPSPLFSLTIPSQFMMSGAKNGSVRAVVMNGGGVDIVFPDTTKYPGSEQCVSLGSAQLKVCQNLIAATVESMRTLMHTMAGAGVKDVLYLAYPFLPPGAIGQSGANVDPNELLDYARTPLKVACAAIKAETGTLTCHYVELKDAFAGNEAEYVGVLALTAMGEQAAAAATWAAMKAACVGQVASGGCCVP